MEKEKHWYYAEAYAECKTIFCVKLTDEELLGAMKFCEAQDPYKGVYAYSGRCGCQASFCIYPDYKFDTQRECFRFALKDSCYMDDDEIDEVIKENLERYLLEH